MVSDRILTEKKKTNKSFWGLLRWWPKLRFASPPSLLLLGSSAASRRTRSGQRQHHVIPNRLQEYLTASNINHLTPNHSDLFIFSKAPLKGNEIKKGLSHRVWSRGGSSSAKSQGFTESLFSETEEEALLLQPVSFIVNVCTGSLISYLYIFLQDREASRKRNSIYINLSLSQRSRKQHFKQSGGIYLCLLVLQERCIF